MSWTDERIQELTRLWQAGLSASDIGKRLGMSKNAVVGKAHRLKLPSRPSPIKHTAALQPPQTGGTGGKAPKAAGAARASKTARGATAARSAPAARSPGAGDAAATAGDTKLVQRRQAAVRAVTGARGREPAPTAGETGGRSKGCLWPIGDPGDSDFHFCGEEPLPGKPYCAEHAARAYITRTRERDRDRQEREERQREEEEAA